MESIEHHRLKQIALRWLQRNGCVAFACEVTWSFLGIIDAAGIKRGGDVYLVEAKVSTSDLKADSKRRKSWKMSVWKSYDFMYYIISDVVDASLIDDWIGILDQHGRVQRKAKRQSRSGTRDTYKDLCTIASACSWRAYGHVIREEKEQLEFCV